MIIIIILIYKILNNWQVIRDRKRDINLDYEPTDSFGISKIKK